ncbi:hypothetical protein J6590_097581, partial [Homalodisca vitripennis]
MHQNGKLQIARNRAPKIITKRGIQGCKQPGLFLHCGTPWLASKDDALGGYTAVYTPALGV